MEFTYTCSEDDFSKAARLLVFKRQRRLIAISAMSFLVLLYAPFMIFHNPQARASLGDPDRWPRDFAGLILPLMICLAPFFIWYSSKRVYRRTPVLRESRTISFSDTGYVARSASASGQVAWSVYDRFYEDKHSFLLMQKGNQIFLPIPKRELGPIQVDALRSLLEGHLLRK